MAYEKTFGTLFKIGDGALASTPTYTTIAQVRSIGDFNIAAVLAEVTNHSSTAGFREKIQSGLFEVDDIEIELVYDPAQATHANSSGGVMHALLNGTKLAYQIVLPDTGNSTWSFDAYVQSCNTQIGEGEEALMQTVTLTITGQPTLT